MVKREREREREREGGREIRTVRFGKTGRSKIDAKNPSNIYQKSIKLVQNFATNQPQIALGAVLRGFWKLLAAKIEKSELLVALGAVLGASWGRLGAWIAVLGGLGAVLGRLKINTKINQKFDASRDRFYEGFSWILEKKMEASWHKNRSQTYLTSK